MCADCLGMTCKRNYEAIFFFQVTNRKTLYGGDMMTTTEIIRSMARKMEEDIKTFPDQQQKETIVKDLLSGAVRTGSNLLDASQKASWQDLSFQDQMKVATSLMVGLEENAFLLANLVLNAGTVIQPMKNIRKYHRICF